MSSELEKVDFNFHGVVSVVGLSICHKDNAMFLQEAINSILLQTDSTFLLIIVVDGPLAKENKDYILSIKKNKKNILIVESVKNKGLAYSMNRIIEFVVENDGGQVRYFFRMDADDICFPERFKKQIEYLERHDLDILGAGCIEIDESGNQIGLREMPITHDEIIAVMPRRCVLNHPTTLIRFDVFRSGFRYNSALMNTQDYYLWADLIAAGYHFGNFPEPLLYFRRDSKFLSRRGRKKATNDLRARFNMMIKLGKLTPFNIVYALAFFTARMMPEPILNGLYFLNGYVKNNRKNNG